VNKLFAIIVLPISLLLVNISLAGEPDIKLHEKCLYPTVRIDSGDGSGFGSGVIVRSEELENKQYMNVVLTCKHVAVNLVDPNVIFTTYTDWSVPTGFKSFPATVYLNHPQYDLAIVLFISYKKMPCAELGMDEKLYVGDELMSFGCALRQPPRLDTGKISGVLPNSLRADLISVPGDSGGPVFHNYKLVGIKQAFFGVDLIENAPPSPIFDFAVQVRIAVLKPWAESDKKAGLPFKEDATLPELPVLMLQARQLKDIRFIHPLLRLMP